LNDRTHWSAENGLSASIGEPAIWAFRDHKNDNHVGTVLQIKSLGLQLLKDRALSNYPMAAAEMAGFCDVEASHSDVMLAAFSNLSEISLRGAETWRDTVLFLPRIKEDIARQLSPGSTADISQVFAITHEGTTHVHAPRNITKQITRLPKWNALAQIFKIKSFKLHEHSAPPIKDTDKQPTAHVIGIGGVARWLVERPPFNGQPLDFSISRSKGAIATFPLTSSLFSRTKDLIVAITSSDLAHAEAVEAITHRITSDAWRHLINVRPIGFGTPRPDKASPLSLRDKLTNFDYVWIVSNHRQRQSGTYANQLSALHSASRYTKATALALIACAHSSENNQLLASSSSRGGKFGLAGAVRYASDSNPAEIIQQALYTMICEDAYLHSAARIIVLWPNSVRPDESKYQIMLGERHYEVELIQRPLKSRQSDVACLAFDVQLSKRTDKDFQDFCVSLVAGYGWVVRHKEDQSLLLENEGGVIRIWPTQSIQRAKELLDQPAEYGSDDIIITNRTIPQKMISQAEKTDWSILHYSELGRWLSDNQRTGLFKDL
jgi:hypothetical protein